MGCKFFEAICLMPKKNQTSDQEQSRTNEKSGPSLSIVEIQEGTNKQLPLKTGIDNIAAAIGHTFSTNGGSSGLKSKVGELEQKITGHQHNSCTLSLSKCIEALERKLKQLQEDIHYVLVRIYPNAEVEVLNGKTNLRTKVEDIEKEVHEEPKDGDLFGRVESLKKEV